MQKQIIYIVLFLFTSLNMFAQLKLSREEYILKYSELAMKEMKRTGIPASITLAQGCLESDNGNSTLAVNANNHFGIKCHDWKGASVRHDDDEDNECFRKYRTARESFIDHSEFLTTKSRYEDLFKLRPEDYKAWARGLKKAGYATNPQYASKLIVIIEENELYKFDQQVLRGRSRYERRTDPNPRGKEVQTEGRKRYVNNDVEYVIIGADEYAEDLREELSLYPGEIRRYNDLERNFSLDSGMVIYVQPKKNKAERGAETHVVEEGDDMWSISQYYGVKLKSLYQLNNMSTGSEAEVGTEIQLRKRLKTNSSSEKEEDSEVVPNQKNFKEKPKLFREREPREKTVREKTVREKKERKKKSKDRKPLFEEPEEDEVEFELEFEEGMQ